MHAHRWRHLRSVRRVGTRMFFTSAEKILKTTMIIWQSHGDYKISCSFARKRLYLYDADQ